MLLRFKVSNYRSILDPIELSMIAVDSDRVPVRKFDSLKEGVLAVAGIYGPNASGKSNVVESLEWLSNSVAVSLRAWDHSIPRRPFKFDNGSGMPSTYEVEMLIRNIRYLYRLELNDSEVLFEGLYSYPERRRRFLFEREGNDIRFRRGLGALSGTRELLTKSTLALSAVSRFDEPEVRLFAMSLTEISSVGLRRMSLNRSSINKFGFYATVRLLDDRDSRSSAPSLFGDPDTVHRWTPDTVLALLRFADLGVEDVRIDDDIDDESQDVGYRSRYRYENVKFIHSHRGQEVQFEIEDESAGTQTWFSIIGLVLSALRSGQILILDELDASLHPKLSVQLLKLFNDPETNPNGAQLIFTTHDTSLLGHLNRDEIWLTEKDDRGATALTALAEYSGDKVRRSVNLERAYLQGRFGALPDLDQFALRRVLGRDADGF